MTPQELKDLLLIPVQMPDDPKLLESCNGDLNRFHSAVATVAAYTICMCHYSARDMIHRTTTAMSGEKLNTRYGFKDQLHRLNSSIFREMTDLRLMNLGEMDRVMLICREVIAYYEEQLPLMQYSTENFLSRYGCPQRKLVAKSIICQGFIDRMSNMCEGSWVEYGRALLAQETHPGRKSHLLERVLNLVPRFCLRNSLKDSKELSNRIVELVGETRIECDVNNCQELRTGLDCIENQLRDLNLLELHTAWSLEQHHGAEYLRKNAPESYRLLHPNYF